MRRKKIVNFDVQLYTDITDGLNDVVVEVSGKEIYRKPKTKETRIEAYNLYMSERYGENWKEN